MKPPRAIAETAVNRSQFLACRAPSTGSIASLTTSQNKKIRIPVAVAVKNDFTAGERFDIRPSGRPRKMVTPAIAPSRYVWLVDIPCKGHLTAHVSLGTRRPLVMQTGSKRTTPRSPDVLQVGVASERLRHARQYSGQKVWHRATQSTNT